MPPGASLLAVCCAFALAQAAGALAQEAAATSDWPERLDSPFAAHNAYAWRLYGNDRLARALTAGIKHIEIDISYDEAKQQVVVTHDSKPSGNEPELDAFLEPLWQRWTASGLDGFTLILDFKVGSREAAQGVRQVLERHAELLSSQAKQAGQFEEGKITVCLTGSGEAHQHYYDLVPDQGRLLAFGDVGHGGWREIAEEYVPREPAGFVRFVTLPRICFQETATAKGDQHVSEGRLKSVVSACNLRGYRLRIYSYNPVQRQGKLDTSPWDKCVEAGVHMISTDNYEMAHDWWAARVANP